MAFYSSNNIRKIILLVLFIIVLFGTGIIAVDFVGSIFGINFPIPVLKQIKESVFKKKIKEGEDPFLLEKEELYKNNERLVLKEEEIIVREKEVQAKDEEANKKLEILKNKEKDLEKKEKQIANRENQFNDRNKNLREQALKIYNMPPKSAVEILEKQDEAEIVDILREIDKYSDEIGRQSISNYLLKLLGDINKDKAANVLRKFKYSANEDTAVEILDDNELETNESINSASGQ
jgi:hypothetical protein